MAITVFDQQVSTAATKLIQANLNLFNQASGGALVMGSGDFLGDYLETVMWQAAQLVNRRNAYGSGAVTATELAQILERAIKIDQRVGPLKVTPALMDRLGKNPKEAAAVMAAQVSEQLIQDYINVATGAIKAATPVALTSDQTNATATTPSLKGLQQGLRVLGDKAGRVVCWVMSGASYNDLLVNDVLTNAQNLFSIGEVNITQDALGRRFLVTDVPALDDAGTGEDPKATQSVLGLTVGAAVVQTRPVQQYSVDQLGGENVTQLIQGETGFNLALKGYTYLGASGALGTGNKPTSPTDPAERPAAGGKSASPTDAVIYAASSWGISDDRWGNGPAVGAPLSWNQLEVAKALAGVIVKFGAQ